MLNEMIQFDYKTKTNHRAIRRIAVCTVLLTLVFALPLFAKSYTAHAASVTASGKTNTSITLRASASTSSKSLGTLKNNTSLTITSEVFTSKTSTSADTRWYGVTAGGKSGFIKVGRVKDIKFANVTATTSDELNYRTGAGTSMSKAGTVGRGTKVTVNLPAKAAGSNDSWYRVTISGKAYYMAGAYLDFTNKVKASPFQDLIRPTSQRPGLAGQILANPTRGGGARYIGTLSKWNCKKRFKVTGYKNNWVPQGVTTNGDNYYVIFGMSKKQGIVTYSSSGKRLRVSPFSFKMGHPNGITYDPVTGLCYIFKGYQYKCYTWNPATNQFGSAKTPYSSSGIAYDKVTNKLYSSSKTGVRVYSPDGRFTHEKVLSRCSRGGKTYVQDCGAHGGFIFHAVSGKNKHKTNYLDIYREADGAYLGSFKVSLGETESVVVANDGTVELLINHKGTHSEYIWRTPINVKDLM